MTKRAKKTPAQLEDERISQAVRELKSMEVLGKAVRLMLSMSERREYREQVQRVIREKRKELLAKFDRQQFLAKERQYEWEQKLRESELSQHWPFFSSGSSGSVSLSAGRNRSLAP